MIPVLQGQPTITEYPLPTAISNPTAIAKDPDGNLWITETNANKIAKITTNGVVTEYAISTPNSQPTGITAGLDGNIWFTEYRANVIAKIATTGAITEYPLPTPGASVPAITAGPDGALWFTEVNGKKIGRITTNGVITEFGIPSGHHPYGITQGPQGDLWFTESEAQVGRILATGTITEYPLPANSGGPSGIALGPDGNLWFGGGGGIESISAGGAVTVYPGDANQLPLGASFITAGQDGYLWFSTAGSVGRMSASGVYATYPVPSGPNAGVRGITQGPDGNIWFLEAGANKVGKIVLATAPPFAPLTLSPSSLTFTSAYGTNPASQTVVVTAPTPTSFTTSTVLSGYRAFGQLTVAPSGALTTDQTITITLNDTGMSVGTYTGSVSVVTKDGATHIIPVTVTITPTTGNNLAVTPEALSIIYTVGGPVLSPDINISALPSSALAIPFTIAAMVNSPSGGNWLSFTTVTGDTILPDSIEKTPMYQPLYVHVSVNPSGLSPGAYTATVVITPAGGAVVKVPVTLTVRPLVTISANPASLHFTAPVGGSAPPPQTIRLTSASGAVFFSVGGTTTPGQPFWWSIDSQQTPATLTVSVLQAGLTQGTYSGVFTIYPPLSVPALQILNIPVDFTVGSAPYISGVVNAASFSSGSPPAVMTSGGFPGAAVAVGEIVTLSGTNLGPENPLGLALDATGKVSTSLGGVTVAFDDVYLAPLIYVSDRQINCVVPYEAANQYGTALVTYHGNSNHFTLSKTGAVPGIFTLNGSGTGTAAAVNSTGGYNGPDNPAPTGSVITFYLTGEGQTNPRGVTASVTTVNTSSDAPLTPQPVAGAPIVTIGGKPATVLFYGEAPGIVAGVMQLNVQIPTGLPSGNLPLFVSLGSASSQTGVTVAIQ